MTLQQLEYILAVNQFRHFAKAAEYCRVTQPTLSAMIQKLEEELDTKIFDRSQQPVCPTPIGLHIIEQARNVLVQTHRIKNIIEEEKHSLSGIFKLGILPTIAPYLLPRFFPQLMKKYPQLDIRVVEMKTNDIKKALQTGRHRCRNRSRSGRNGRIPANTVILRTVLHVYCAGKPSFQQ